MPASGFKITIPPFRQLIVNMEMRPRPLEPEGIRVVRSSNRERNRPEQMPDEPTILTKGKKRKQRTVDEENPSKSSAAEHTIRSFRARTKTDSLSDLHYSCRIDAVSESQIVEAVQSINYSINNLIFNILDAVKKLKLPVSYRKDRHHDASDTNLDTPLQFLLDENSRLSDESKDLVVEIILVNLIITLLHKHFFKGEHFFGVGSETLYDYLETMLSKLVADENLDPTAIQRWRSMSVEALFQMNEGIVSQLLNEVNTDLRRMLKIVFPLRVRVNRSKTRTWKWNSQRASLNFKSIIGREQQSLLDVIHQARKLSFMIQRDIVSCQLLITIASDALGTCAFGLQRITGSECTVLIKTKFITSSQLQSLLH